MAILARPRTGTPEPGAMSFTIKVVEFVDIITMHSAFPLHMRFLLNSYLDPLHMCGGEKDDF